MKMIKRAASLMAMAGTLCSCHSANAQAASATLTVNLDCMQTTEASEDEVYILVLGRNSGDESVWKNRFPADLPGQEAGHWNMNDRETDQNAPKHINHINLTTGTVADGETVAWDVLVMEEDGGTSMPFQEAAAAVLGLIDNPYTLAASGVLELANKLGLGITDTDDFIGAFTVTVTNNHGTLTTEWNAKNRVYHVDPAGADQYLPAPNSQRYFMNGDGADYHVTCYINGDGGVGYSSVGGSAGGGDNAGGTVPGHESHGHDP